MEQNQQPIPPPPKHISITNSPTRIPVPLSSTTPRRASINPNIPVRDSSPSPTPPPTSITLPPVTILKVEPPTPDEDEEVVVPAQEVISVETEITKEESGKFNSSNYLEELHRKELELEQLAANIAAKTTHSPVISFSSSIGSGLRKRLTNATSSTLNSDNKKDDDATSTVLDQVEANEVLQLMEDEEVARFLERVGKQVTEVRASTSRDAVVLPEPTSFRSSDGKTNWFAFSRAYFTALVHVYTPASLLAPSPYTSFSFVTARNHIERLYVVVPVTHITENLLQGSIANIYRYKSPHKTLTYLFIYTFLWFYDLLPFFPPFAFLLYLLKVVLFPPTPQELLAKAKLRQERNLEAIALSKSLNSNSTKIGFALQGAKGLFTSIIPPSSEKEKEKVIIPVVVGDEIKITKNAAVPEKQVSILKLLKDLAEVLGPEVQELLSQACDISEKVKNLIIHPDHPSINGVCLRLTGICLILLLCPTWIQIKSAWAYLGFEFFFLFKLREDYPELRRALNPIWWLLLDAPTDAEYATYILRKRSSENKPLRGAKTLRRLSRTSRSPSPSSSNVSSKSVDIRNNDDVAITSATAGITPEGLSPDIKRERRLSSSLIASASSLGHRLSDTIKSSSRAPSISDEEILGSHFALLKAVPGTLLITSSRVKFAPSVGVRTLSFKFNKLSSSSSSSSNQIPTNDTNSETSSIKSLESDNHHDEQGYLMNLSLNNLDSIKKKNLLGFEGLELVELDSGKIFSLTNISRRDHAFNLLFSNSNIS